MVKAGIRPAVSVATMTGLTAQFRKSTALMIAMFVLLTLAISTAATTKSQAAITLAELPAPASCAPSVSPSPSSSASASVFASASVSTSASASPSPSATTTVKIHYRPTDSNKTNWVIWSWEDKPGQVGKDFEFTGMDSFGCTAIITYPRAVASVGFIVHQKNSWNKDVGSDRFVKNFVTSTEIWLRAGDARIYKDVNSAVNPPRPADPAWTKNAVMYQVNVRDFSSAGTFKGVTDNLPRLKGMGITVIYLMPIHPIGSLNRKCTSSVNASSTPPASAVCKGSPYSVRDYQAVNSDYGTLADFKTLVTTAHGMGMKVILDWVMNHTAWDNVWVANHKDYYLTDSTGKMKPPMSDWSDVAQLDFNSAAMRTALINAMKFWVTGYDVDGFRLDYASSPYISLDNWDQMATTLNAIKPLFFLAEADSYQALLQSAFVSDYNLPFLYSFLNSVGQGGGSKGNFTYQVQRLTSYYPANTYPVNFITNHDWNAWYGTEFERMGCSSSSGALCTKSDAVAATTTLTALWKGIPMIYNGEEIGLQRRLEFFLKDPIVWPTSLNPKVSSTWNNASPWIKFYTKLYDLKAKNEALASGNYGGDVVEVPNSADKVISFTRTKNGNTVLVVMNISKDTSQTVTVTTGLTNQNLYRYSDGAATTINGNLSLTLKPLQYEIYSSVASTVK